MQHTVRSSVPWHALAAARLETCPGGEAPTGRRMRETRPRLFVVHLDDKWELKLGLYELVFTLTNCVLVQDAIVSDNTVP